MKKTYVLTAITAVGLPLMALGQTQTTDEQQTATQGQKDLTETTAPAKGKKMRPAQQSGTQDTQPGTRTETRGQTNVHGRTQDVNRTGTGKHSTTSQTNVNTTVNKEEFKTRHRDVFSLGRHPKEFFVQRYGANHFRLIGNSYFVFVDGCWVAVDVDGFTYTERVICPGDPEFVAVVD